MKYVPIPAQDFFFHAEKAPLSALDDHIMTILKKTTIPLDVDRICGSLEAENKGLATRAETRKAVCSFLQQWKPYITEQKMPDGSIGYKWKK